MLIEKAGLLISATGQTIEMVFVSAFFAIAFGLPLGVLLFITRNPHLFYQPKTHTTLGFVVNVARSIPFIILLVAITPFTRFIVGTSIGTLAAMVPLTLSAIPFFARLVESAMNEVRSGLIEAALAMGATTAQTVWKVIIPESRVAIVRGITLMLITLVGYSAMAGAVGGGGLCNLAIMYGYERFEIQIMITTVVILVLMVQCLQWGGDWVARKLMRV